MNTKKILIVVDMQEDFIRGPLGNEDCRNAVQGCVDLCKSGEFDHIIFTRDTHFENYLNTLEGEKLPVKHCINGSNGWEIIPELAEFVKNSELKEGIGSNVINKFTFGSLTLTDMIEPLRNGLNDIELHFAGVCTSICVLSNMTICRAKYPDVKIVLHKNATGDVTPEMKNAAFICANAIQCEVVE